MDNKQKLKTITKEAKNNLKIFIFDLVFSFFDYNFNPFYKNNI